MAASALSAVLGFGREIATAHFFGTRAEVDAFLNASTVPIVLFGIFNGSLVGALVPTFSDYTSHGRDDEMRRLGSTVLNGLFIIVSCLAALGWLLAPVFVPLVAHGFPPAEQALEIRMVRWLMPGVVATTLSGVCTALLNAKRQFVGSALVWTAANLVTIGLVVALHAHLGIFALVLGSVLGLFAQLLVQLPGIIRNRLYRFELDVRHPGLAKAWALFIPITMGSGAWQINLGFDRYFASTLDAGSTAGLGYTTKVVFLPILIVAGAISTTIFPLIAGQFATSDKAGIRRSVSMAVRMVGFIVLPCAAGLIALAHPIIRTLFERGAFGPSSTAFCASLVPYACVPLIAISFNVVMGRACYACKDVKMQVWTSTVVVGINIALSSILIHPLGARGLLLSNGLAMFFGTTFLNMRLWRIADGLEWKPVVSSLTRVAAAAAIMGLTLSWIASINVVAAFAMVSRPLHLGVLLGLGSVLFVAASRVLKIEELSLVTGILTKKFTRRTAAPLAPEVNSVA